MEIITCKEAKAQNLSKYFTGKSCPKGHVASRYVANGSCCDCHIQGTTTYQGKWRRIARNKLINFLGGKCVKCGFSDARALQIDHVSGGGVKEIIHVLNRNKSKYYKQVYEDTAGKYQLLCANCNWIKRHENNER